MRIIHLVLSGFLFAGGSLIPQTLLSETLTLVNAAGENIEIELGATDRFLDVLEYIQSYFQDNGFLAKGCQEPHSLAFNPGQFDLTFSHAGVVVRAKNTEWRDYQASVSKDEKKDVAYVIKTLGFESLLSIGQKRSSLKKAGDRIDHLHPFRFLMTVFNDEELKAGIHAIKDRGGWVWSGFVDGIVGSLSDEAKNQNLLQFSSDFAQKVKIDPALISPYLQQGLWGDFLNVLLNHIPRQIDPNRYNM